MFLFFHFLLWKMLNICKNREANIHHCIIIINSWPFFFLYPPPFPHLPYWIILKQISHNIIRSSYISYVSLKGRNSFLSHKVALFIFKSSVYLKFIFEYDILLTFLNVHLSPKHLLNDPSIIDWSVQDYSFPADCCFTFVLESNQAVQFSCTVVSDSL